MIISPSRLPAMRPSELTPVAVSRLASATIDNPVFNSHAQPGFFARHFLNSILAFASTPNRLLSNFPHHVSPTERRRLLPDLKTVELQSVDKVSLKGYWLPANKKSSSTVILLHGFSSNAGSMVPLALKLHDWGHSVFMLDFRSHGQSGAEKPCTLGFEEGKDVLAAIRQVKKNYPEAARDITLLGHSMGASAILSLPKSLRSVPGALDDISGSVNRIVLDSPYERLDFAKNPFISRLFQAKWVNYLFPDLGYAFVELLNSTDLMERMNLPSTLNAFRPAQDFLKSKAWSEKPVLLLHGNRDSTTPYEQAERIHQQLQNKGVDIKLVTLNANHVNPNWSGSESWFPKRVALRDNETYLKALEGHLQGKASIP